MLPQQQQSNPMAQALAQFMQGMASGSSPLISAPAPQTTVEKPGKAITFKNALSSLGSVAKLSAGDIHHDNFANSLGGQEAKRTFGGQTVKTGPQTVQLANQAPQLYWGGLLNQQNPNLKF